MINKKFGNLRKHRITFEQYLVIGHEVQQNAAISITELLLKDLLVETERLFKTFIPLRKSIKLP